MKKLALLLSLLALGALGLVACGGGDDDKTAAASATEITDDELAADSKSCGAYERWRLAVVKGGISCREARRVLYGVAYGGVPDRVPDGWSCIGGDQPVECRSEAGGTIRAPVRKAVLRRWEAAEADPDNNNRLSLKERIGTKANQWAALFAAGRDSWRFMRQPAGERMSCERVPNRPIRNCRPPSAEFRQSFADATVERVALKPHHHHAMAEFSNGESVEFEGLAPWYITERSVKKITRSHGTGATHRLSEERIEQAGNDFAALFAEGGFKPGLWHYMGQPAGERMDCERVGNNPIKNCTPVSVEFRRTFDGATVERVVVSEDHRHARAEFSNGESVEFDGQRADEGDKGEGWGNWAYFITETWIKNAGRR